MHNQEIIMHVWAITSKARVCAVIIKLIEFNIYVVFVQSIRVGLEGRFVASIEILGSYGWNLMMARWNIHRQTNSWPSPIVCSLD